MLLSSERPPGRQGLLNLVSGCAFLAAAAFVYGFVDLGSLIAKLAL